MVRTRDAEVAPPRSTTRFRSTALNSKAPASGTRGLYRMKGGGSSFYDLNSG